MARTSFSNSKTIRAVDYQAATMEMDVEFKNGSTIRHRRVPEVVHRMLVMSSRPDTFYQERIQRRYPFTRL